MVTNSFSSITISFILLIIVTIFVWVGLINNPIYSKHSDKMKHLLASFITAFPIGCIAFFTNNSMWYLIGILFSWFVWIFGKEFVHDKWMKKGEFEMGDIYADIAGSVILNLLTLYTIALGIEFFSKV